MKARTYLLLAILVLSAVYAAPSISTLTILSTQYDNTSNFYPSYTAADAAGGNFSVWNSTLNPTNVAFSFNNVSDLAVTQDYSGNNYIARIPDSANTVFVTGRDGSPAMYFGKTTNMGINITNWAGQSNTSPFSVVVDYRQNTTPTGTQKYGIAAVWDSGSNRRSWLAYTNTTGYFCFDTTPTGSTAGNELCSNVQNSNNTWYLVVFVYGTTNNSIYIDGVLAASKDRGTDGLNNTVTMTVGAFRSNGALSSPVNGTLDNYRFLGYELTPEQVLLMNSSRGSAEYYLSNTTVSAYQNWTLMQTASNTTTTTTSRVNFQVDPPLISYFVCPTGSDSNDGLTSGTPVKTLAKVNTFAKRQHMNISFCAGGVWIVPQDAYPTFGDGSYWNRLVYNSYGSGSKPLFIGSWNLSYTANWTQVAANQWETTFTEARGIGNLFYNEWTAWGIRNMSVRGNRQGDFYFNATNNKIVVYSTSNPASYYTNIYAGVGSDTFDWDSADFLTIEGLEIRGGGRHCSAGVDTSFVTHNKVTIDKCGGDESPIRVGNCLEYGQSSRNSSITNNTIYDCFDACYSNQAWDPSKTIVNVTFQNNLLYKCHYGLEFFMDKVPADIFRNVIIDHNTIADTGFGWSDYPISQRDPPSNANSIRIAATPAGSAPFNFTNNIFYNTSARHLAICEGSTNCTGAQWYFNNNLYYNGSTSGIFIDWVNNQYRSLNLFRLGVAAGNESAGNQINTSALFVSKDTGDFRPLNNSLACTMSSTGSYVGALQCSATCTNDLQNSSWSAWANQSTCTASDTQLQNRSYTITDANACGNYTDTLVWGYQNISCVYCGNNLRNGTEQCDGTDLNNQTCVTRGFKQGTLSCSASCTFDTGGCNNINPYIDSLYNTTAILNSQSPSDFIGNVNDGVGQQLFSVFFLAFFFVFIMALKRFPIEDVVPAVSFVFFILAIIGRQAGLLNFYTILLMFFIMAASIAYNFIKGN